jgi:exoribonuclease-2
LRAKVFELAHKPDKNSLEYKALSDACAETNLSPVRLLDKCGAIPSSHEFHRAGLPADAFPARGGLFRQLAAPLPPPELPAGRCPGVQHRRRRHHRDRRRLLGDLPADDGSVRVGIHIAAPALGITPGSDLDKLAATRLSTVYMPGDKITMLPEDLIAQYTLAENRDCPALSLYVDVGAGPRHPESLHPGRLVRIAANLRHETLEPLFNEATIGQPGEDYPFRRELEWLYGFARHLEGVHAARPIRCSATTMCSRSRRTGGHRAAGARQSHRQAGVRDDDPGQQPLGRHAGRPQRGRHLPGADRRQGAHDAEAGAARGAGRAHATPGAPRRCGAMSICSTSGRSWPPIRARETPPHAGNDPMLFAAVRDFELAYDAYAEFQRGMERYWCLRWLLQEGIPRSMPLSGGKT